MNATRERLVQILIKTRAFKWSPTPSFPLASGALSRFYIACRVGLSYPEAREVVGDLLLERIVQPVTAVGGPSITMRVTRASADGADRIKPAAIAVASGAAPRGIRSKDRDIAISS